MADQRDDHAARLLHLVVLPIVDIVHEGDADEAAKALERYDAPQLREIALMLAGLVDPNVPWEQALAWLTEPPADVVPLHCDEWYGDAPPMRVAWLGDPPALDVGPLWAERYQVPEAKR